MKEADISRALTSHLEAAALGYPIVWPNKDSDPQVGPYLDVQIVRGPRATTSLAGGQRSEGYLQVTVVAPLDGFATPAEIIADEVSDAFPIASRITGTGGKLSIERSRIVSGFRDDVHWRVPVRIDYRAMPSGAATAAAFNAANYGTPLAWWDGYDAATITLVGSKVSSWESKGTITLNAAQAVDSQRPTYSAAGFGGLPIIDFSAAENIGLLLDADMTVVDQDYTFFIVLDATVVATSSNYFFDSFWSGNANRFLFNFNNATSVRQYMSGGSVSYAVPSGVNLLSFRLKNADSSGYADGVLVSSGNPYTPTQIRQPTGLGGEFGAASRGIEGGIAEVIIYDGALTPAVVAEVNAALQTKWGLI